MTSINVSINSNVLRVAGLEDAIDGRSVNGVPPHLDLRTTPISREGLTRKQKKKIRNFQKRRDKRAEDKQNRRDMRAEDKRAHDATPAPMVITDFSGGYGGNGLALTASASELAIASGIAAPLSYKELQLENKRLKDEEAAKNAKIAELTRELEKYWEYCICRHRKQTKSSKES